MILVNTTLRAWATRLGTKPVFFASLSHLGLAIILFAPFVFFGRVLVGSSDNLCVSIPFYLLSRENFTQHQIGSWDPYHFAGMEFCGNWFNFNFSPTNWVLFLFPKQWTFHTLTMNTMIEVWLIGLFSYCYFREELKTPKWALFSSVCYQLCSFVFWTITVHPNTTILLYLTASLYFVWSFHRRRLVLSYVYLTLSVTMMLLSGNIVLGFYALLLIIVLSCYRMLASWGKPFPPSLSHGAFCLSIGTSLLISTVRLYPLFEAIKHSSRIEQGYFSIHDVSFMFVRLFDPEIFGVSNYVNLLDRMTTIYRWSDVGFNIQNTFPLYFGVLPVLLVVWGMVAVKDPRVRFWKYFVVVTCALALRIQPIAGVFNIIMYPLLHSVYLIILVPLGICALAGHAAEYLEAKSRELSIRPAATVVAILAAVTLCFGLVFLGYDYPAYTNFIRLVLLAVVSCVVAIYIVVRQHRVFQVGTSLLLDIVAALTVVCMLALIVVSVVNATQAGAVMRTLGGIVSVAWSLVSIVLIMLAFPQLSGANPRPKIFISALAVAIAGMAAIMITPWWRITSEDYTVNSYMVFAWLGLLRFALVGSLFLTVFYLLSKGQFLTTLLCPFFTLVIAFDLLGFNMHFRHIVEARLGTRIVGAFSTATDLYPEFDNYRILGVDGMPLEIDRLNYRLNGPGADQDAASAAKYLTDFSPVYHTHIYGGNASIIDQRFSRFVAVFNPTFAAGLNAKTVIPANLQEERFLDLSAVRYKPDPQTGGMMVRPHSLSRLMLFYSYEGSYDAETALSRLKDPTFNPETKVVLHQEIDGWNRDPFPLLPINTDSRSGTFVPIISEDSEHVSAHVKTDIDAILLFDDCYAQGWHAFGNGKELPLLHANYAFMATVVPAGEYDVEFRFRPPVLREGIKLMKYGFILFIFTVASLVGRGRCVSATESSR